MGGVYELSFRLSMVSGLGRLLPWCLDLDEFTITEEGVCLPCKHIGKVNQNPFLHGIDITENNLILQVKLLNQLRL